MNHPQSPLLGAPPGPKVAENSWNRVVEGLWGGKAASTTPAPSYPCKLIRSASISGITSDKNWVDIGHVHPVHSVAMTMP